MGNNVTIFLFVIGKRRWTANWGLWVGWLLKSRDFWTEALKKKSLIYKRGLLGMGMKSKMEAFGKIDTPSNRFYVTNDTMGRKLITQTLVMNYVLLLIPPELRDSPAVAFFRRKIFMFFFSLLEENPLVQESISR